MAPTIHCVRHAQGIHNLSIENESIRDPELTPMGIDQCAVLREAFKHHDKIDRLVASPMRRTLQTCINAFGRDDLYPIIALDLLQEVSDAFCDIGSGIEAIVSEFGDKVDVRMVGADWTQKEKGSIHEPTIDMLAARAKKARHVLRELTSGLDEDSHIVVVSHDGFLHFLTDDWQEISLFPGLWPTGWTNCEYRSYQFVDPSGTDDDAALQETLESRLRRGSTQIDSDLSQQKRRLEAQEEMIPFLKVKS